MSIISTTSITVLIAYLPLDARIIGHASGAPPPPPPPRPQPPLF